MNIKDLQEAMEILKDPNSSERSLAYQTLKRLAEDVIKIAGIMPKKKSFSVNDRIREDDNYIDNIINCNRTIDNCIMAMAGRVSVERIAKIIEKSELYRMSNYCGRPQGTKKVSQSIVNSILKEEQIKDIKQVDYFALAKEISKVPTYDEFMDEPKKLIVCVRDLQERIKKLEEVK